MLKQCTNRYVHKHADLIFFTLFNIIIFMAGGSYLLAKWNNHYDAVKDQYSLAQWGGGGEDG